MKILPVLALLLAGCASSMPLPGAVTVAGSTGAAASPAGANTGHLVLKIATATKPPLHIAIGSSGAFAILAKNNSISDQHVTVSFDVGKLPINATLCESNPQTGQCLAAPSATLELKILHGQAPTFSAFLTPTKAISLGTVRVEFTQKSAVLGSGKVTVTTKP
jgi:hypothetical protein